MATALIIGASRGIGQELVRQYLADGWRVIATARKPEDTAALHARAEVHTLDVNNVEAVAGLGWKLDGEELTSPSQRGRVRPAPRRLPHADRLRRRDAHQCAGGHAAAAHPRAAGLRRERQAGRAVLAHGFLSERSNPSGSLYRASKAALNSVLIDTAHTFGPQGATCVAFHPGWVRTDMGGTEADLSVQQSAAGMRATLAALPATTSALLP
jgi:NAD(P)-dependent dehydrogenase (short-subunit alcohol dehydrogenase family)